MTDSPSLGASRSAHSSLVARLLRRSSLGSLAAPRSARSSLVARLTRRSALGLLVARRSARSSLLAWPRSPSAPSAFARRSSLASLLAPRFASRRAPRSPSLLAPHSLRSSLLAHLVPRSSVASLLAPHSPSLLAPRSARPINCATYENLATLQPQPRSAWGGPTGGRLLQAAGPAPWGSFLGEAPGHCRARRRGGAAPPGASSRAGRNFKHSQIKSCTGVYFLNF